LQNYRDKAMKLVINTLSARQGGGQVYVSNILRFVKDYPDIKTYVLADPEFAHLYNYPSVELICRKELSQNILKRVLWEKYSLPLLLERLHTDLVFCPGGTINFAPPAGCKTAVTFQNMLIFDKDNRRKYRIGYTRFRLAMLERMSRKSFEKADLVIFLTDYAKEVIDAQVPRRKGVSVVIPHGLDGKFRTADRGDIPRCEGLPDGQYLLYTSVITNFKAHLEVVRAYYILTQIRDTEEKLLLVGHKYKSYEKLLRKEMKKLHLQEKVFIIGEMPLNLMPSVYHHAKAHIFASTCENCPNIVIESLGSGRPIFLSNIPPMPEIAGDAAIYFDPYNPEQLADLLLKCLDNEQLTKQLGQRAFERSANFSWSKTAHQTFDAFGNLFDERAKERYAGISTKKNDLEQPVLI
jgi:glycosyltransferase involved in cell wall biosynthesis